MANLNKKLGILFNQYLKRKEKERLTPSYVNYGSCVNPAYRHNNSWMQSDTENYDGVIYFYEWSDPERAPQLFYNLNAFDAFLRRSEIFMPPFQKDIIKQLDRAYITCKKGTHDLLIRGTRALLIEAAARNNPQGVDVQTATQAIMHTPAPVGAGRNPMGMQFEGARQPPMYNGYPDQWY